MFKHTNRSRPFALATLALALLAVSTFEFPTQGARERPVGPGQDVAQTVATVAAWHPTAEPYLITQYGFDLIWNHLH